MSVPRVAGSAVPYCIQLIYKNSHAASMTDSTELTMEPFSMHYIRFPASATALCVEAFRVEAKRENARVFEISARLKDSQGVKINPEPSSTARLIVCVVSVR